MWAIYLYCISIRRASLLSRLDKTLGFSMLIAVHILSILKDLNIKTGYSNQVSTMKQVQILPASEDFVHMSYITNCTIYQSRLRSRNNEQKVKALY